MFKRLFSGLPPVFEEVAPSSKRQKSVIPPTLECDLKSSTMEVDGHTIYECANELTSCDGNDVIEWGKNGMILVEKPKDIITFTVLPEDENVRMEVEELISEKKIRKAHIKELNEYGKKKWVKEAISTLMRVFIVKNHNDIGVWLEDNKIYVSFNLDQTTSIHLDLVKATNPLKGFLSGMTIYPNSPKEPGVQNTFHLVFELDPSTYPDA